MTTFTLNLDDNTYQAALSRAQQEGLSLEQILAQYLDTYAADAPPIAVVQPAVPQPSPASPQTYTVQGGDTLTKIARAVYGDAAKYPLIQQANNIDNAGRIWVGQVLVIPSLSGVTPAPIPQPPTPPAPQPVPQPVTPPAPQPQPTPVQPTPPPQINPGAAIPNVSYKLLSINGPITDRPAPIHADLNFSMRGFEPTGATRGLIGMNGATDPRAPQLRGLFADKRTPAFPAVYRVYDWDWAKGPQGGRGNILSRFEVTLMGMTTQQGEVVHVPNAGYSIGEEMQVLLLYATSERLTIKYTREDNVIDGYTIHIEGISVDPALQSAYDERDQVDRRQLVALAAGSPLGRALGTEIKVAIRDKGRFMDPRTEKDWWRGA
ncbi:MAG: LysM peptidoglycan-binding domain-containing protein [Chloroflexota bacterium]